MKEKKEVPQGTLALMVLKTLDVLGPLHGTPSHSGSNKSAATCSA